MEVQFGPNALDEPNLLYVLQRKLKVFNTTDSLPNRGYSLVATSSQLGIVFIASPDASLSVYYLKQLIDKNCENPQHISVRLPEKPSHIAVNCDQTILAVLGGGILLFYQVAAFENKNASPFLTLKADVAASDFVSSLQWNPCVPDQIAVAYFSGVLLVAQVHSKAVKKVQSKARCVCWSPKGKQLVTGNSDGSLWQLKPELTPAKSLPAPSLFEGAAPEAAAVHWVSTYQFAAVFRNSADASRPVVTIINTPKGGQMTCLNYEDICYSMGSSRPWYYYLQGIPQWNIILASSSNSMEIATLGSSDGANWLQWCQPDDARPELPLTDKTQENFPVGVCLDTCALHQLPWGENETLPPMPLLLVLSQTGLLALFNVINLNKAAPQICAPPQQFTLNAADLTSAIPGENAAATSETPSKPVEAQPKKSLFGLPSQPVGQKASWDTPVTQFATSGTPPVAAKVTPPTSQFGAVAAPKVTQFGAVGAPKVPASQAAVAPSLGVQQQPPQQQPPPPYGQPPSSVASAPKSQVENKPAHQQPTQVQAPAPQPAPAQAKSSAPTAEANAHLKAEQERASALKANEELKRMAVREANDIQTELYKFKVNVWETQTAVNKDLAYLDSTLNVTGGELGDNLLTLTTDRLRKECSLEELRAAVVQLKLDLVRTCAVVAEARTHSEVKDAQWTQTDPLSTKRLSSVKKLAYYVRNQLEQAHKALDHRWSESQLRSDKPGQRMIRPILDDVYQPLVKQQEILSRQEALLKTLKKTLSDCDATPVFKTTGLLRSTPFKKDPLSKLTKNILNMNIEPDSNRAKEASITAHKLEALRDLLSHHKTTKVKHVEMRQHLAAMRLNYEKSVKEKAASSVTKGAVPGATVTAAPAPKAVQTSQPVQPVQRSFAPLPQQQPAVSKPPAPQPTAFAAAPFAPAAAKPTAFVNVARTLFTDEPSQEPAQTPKPQPTPAVSQTAASIPKPTPAFGFAAPAVSSPSLTTRSALKDLLQSKSQLNEVKTEPKNEANTFMGQKICSPSSFAASTPISAVPTATATSQPISDMASMLNKYQPKPLFGAPAQLPSKILLQTDTNVNVKSAETGEPEGTSQLTILDKQDSKPKPLASNTQNAGAFSVTSQNAPSVSFGKIDGITKLEPKVDKSKENMSEKAVKEGDKKENSAPKPLAPQTSKPSGFPAIETALSSPPAPQKVEKPIQVAAPETTDKKDTKPATPKSAASSLFATANAAVSNPPKSPTETTAATSPSSTSLFGATSLSTTATSPSAASIFGSAAAKSPPTFGTSGGTSPTQTGSLFGASSSASSIFASAASPTQGSIFGGSATAATTQSSTFGTSSAQSVFASAAKPSVFSTPTPSSSTSVFGTSATTQSVFGTTTSTTQSSVFASPTSQASIFASKPTSAASVFGSATASTTAQASVFGSATVTTTQASAFGSPTTSQTSIFGTPTATTQASVFGTAPASSQATVFGAATTQASVFGTAASPATQTSVFGTPTVTTQASVFGTPKITQASVFGTPTPTTQVSVFGTPAATTQASVFGTPTTQSSVFGTPPQTTSAQAGSLFGGAESNLFAAASISTTSAPSQPTGNIFGGGSPSSVFGGAGASTNVFGGKAAFGQSNAAAASIFGGGGATSFGQKPAQPQANNFWGANTTSSSSAFGTSAFGQTTTTQASIFGGGGGGGSFSSPSASPGSAFGAPQGSVFGTPQQAAAPAFGGSPVFGTKPAFGQSPGFGSPSGFGQPAYGGGGFSKSPSGGGFGAPAAFGGGATFGGGAAFGSISPGKVFGGGAPAPSFGAPTQSNATFESLATQNTMTFGNLAQQSPPQQQAAPTFNTSPSFTGWRG